MSSRNGYYKGIACESLSDDMVTSGTDISQALIPWASQSKYSKYTVYFGVVTIFIACVKYLWTLYRDYTYKKNPKRQGVVAGFISVFISYSRYVGYKQLPYLVSYYTSLPQSCGSTLFVMASSLFVYLYCLVPHYWYRECESFGSPPLAIRAGVMATSLTPFIYVLGGKSNIISLLTGFSYEKLNVFHQYVGVTSLALALIHTIPYVYQSLLEGGTRQLATDWDDIYMYSGTYALAILIFLCIASKAIVRKYIYETFYHLHWAAGAAYIGTLVWHINYEFDCEDYMWGAIAFWGAQLLYRLFVKTAFKPNKLFLRPRVAFLRRFNDRSFEVVVENTVGYKWVPGQHVFLRFAGSRILDNHPFSICTTAEAICETDPTAPMKFIIIPKKGLTGKLHNSLTQDVREQKVYVDGPYGGSPRDYLAFDRLILIATGSGVSATLPFLIGLAQHVAKCKAEKAPILLKGVNFIWIVKFSEDIDWIKDELSKCHALASEYIKVDIFVTSDNSSASIKSEEKISDVHTDTKEDLVYNLYHFKPEISELLSKIQPTLGRRNMIVSSGSDSLKISVSTKASQMQTVVMNSDMHNSYVEEIYLHTESFGW